MSANEDNPSFTVGPTAASMARVGSAIRQIRTSRRMSLRELARLIGVSPSHVSQVERGKVSPSVTLLYSIADAFGLRVDQLFQAENGISDTSVAAEIHADPATVIHAPVDDSPAIVRRGEHKEISMASGVTWQQLTRKAEPHHSFRRITYKPGASSAENNQFVRHSGRESGVILEGTLFLQLAFEEYELRAGDSITYNSSIPHRFWNPSETDVTTAIWVHLF